MIYALKDRKVKIRGRCYIAPNASVIGSVVLGNNTSVWFGCVLRGDNDVITIGEGSNVQDAAVLHTDEGIALTVGRGVSIGHKAMLHGCTVGDNSLVGINAVVLNHAVIGRNCLVGANALIAEGKEVPDGSLVLGSPGRISRSLDSEEIKALRSFAVHYVEKISLYEDSLTSDPRSG